MFELILNYFGSKNLSLYHNTILAMLITDRHSVHFSPLHLFGLLRSISLQLGSFSLLRSIHSNSVHLVHFRRIFQSIQSTSVSLGLLWSILSNSVQFGALGPINSTSVYLVHSVHSIQFVLFSPLRTTWSISNHFCPIRCTYLRIGKCKFGLRVLLFI